MFRAKKAEGSPHIPAIPSGGPYDFTNPRSQSFPPTFHGKPPNVHAGRPPDIDEAGLKGM